MGDFLNRLFGRKPPAPAPVDVVTMRETRAAGLCTLSQQLSAWQNSLDIHSGAVEKELGPVDTDIERLETTKQGFEGLKESITKHRKFAENTRKTATSLLDSFTLEPDPVVDDTIGLHEGTLTRVQAEQKESLTNMLRVLGEEMDSMYSREESTETELDGITDKLERLNATKKTLETERDVTNAFKENIKAFTVSKIAPPKD